MFNDDILQLQIKILFNHLFDTLKFINDSNKIYNTDIHYKLKNILIQYRYTINRNYIANLNDFTVFYIHFNVIYKSKDIYKNAILNDMLEVAKYHVNSLSRKFNEFSSNS